MPTEPISDYDQTRQKVQNLFATAGGSEKGNPDKAMELLVDLIRQDGSFAGKGLPENGYVYLGHDSGADLRTSVEEKLRGLEKWKDLFADIEFDD